MGGVGSGCGDRVADAEGRVHDETALGGGGDVGDVVRGHEEGDGDEAVVVAGRKFRDDVGAEAADFNGGAYHGRPADGGVGEEEGVTVAVEGGVGVVAHAAAGETDGFHRGSEGAGGGQRLRVPSRLYIRAR